MNLEDFVNSLPLSSFEALRKTVLVRHHRHAEEIVKGLEYLMSQPSLCQEVDTNREACESVLVEKTSLDKGIVTKVVNRYIQLRDTFGGVNPLANISFDNDS